MNLDEFSKQLIDRAVAQLDEKSKCNHTSAGTSCPLHGDADCNSSKQNRAEEVEHVDEGLKQARKNVGASTCWDGYKAKGTKTKDGKEVPNCVKEEEITEKKDLPGNQEKIDANKNGKIDAHDFAMLRNKKAKKSMKEMWEKAAEITEAKKKAVEIEVMPEVEIVNDPESPTGKKPNKKLKKEEVEELDEKKGLWDRIHAKRKRGEKPSKPGDEDYPKTLKVEEDVELEEKKLSKAEAAKKEKFVKGMKKKFGSFKSKYGEKAKEVMYATATKMGKKAA